MKRYHLSIIIPLLLSLFIYLIYRIDETNINLLLKSFFHHNFTDFKNHLNTALPIPSFIIYNLPEGLWVFSISLLGANLYITRKGFRIHMIYVPLLFAFILEIMQALHITNGTFDMLDLLVSFVAWILAFLYYQWPINHLKELQNNSIRFYAFFFVFACVYLSDIDNIFGLSAH